MKVIPVFTPNFHWSGRGAELIRWLPYEEVRGGKHAQPEGGIYGALFSYDLEDRWVIFDGLQAILVAGEEVHSGWYMNLIDKNISRSWIWKVNESDWMKTFIPMHLSGHEHFVLEFYDDIVEIVCKQLIFGTGKINARLRETRETKGDRMTDPIRETRRQKFLGNVRFDVAQWEKQGLRYDFFDRITLTYDEKGQPLIEVKIGERCPLVSSTFAVAEILQCEDGCAIIFTEGADGNTVKTKKIDDKLKVVLPPVPIE